MKIYLLKREEILPITITEAWAFFSSPYNLEKITPSYLNFRIISAPDTESIFEGMEIDYIVKPILNIPVKWKTIISDVDEPYCFKDKQQNGPYALWEHTHSFKQAEGGVKMTDEVRYALPLGILGRMVHALQVKRQLEGIFNYRQKVLKEIFNKKNAYTD